MLYFFKCPPVLTADYFQPHAKKKKNVVHVTEITMNYVKNNAEYETNLKQFE